jgi:riboflavin transporter FmnP
VTRKLIVIGLVAGLAVAFRKQLLHLLTRTTGTWVGTEK